MSRLLPAVFFLIAFSAAFADVRLAEDKNAVSVPYTEWELTFPSAGWSLDMQSVTQDGLMFNYGFNNPKRGLTVFIYLEPAFRCASGEACRAMFWEDPGPIGRDAKEVRFFEQGKFAGIEFTSMRQRTRERYWSMHMVHDDVMVHVQIYTPEKSAKNFSAIKTFAEKLTIGQKALCPMCVKPTKFSRQQSMVMFARVMNDAPGAFEQLRKLAESGDAEAQFMLSRVYSWGSVTIDVDEPKAVEWARRAAEQGHAEAQATLAYFMDLGFGFDQSDTPGALVWLNKSAEQQLPAALLGLSNIYATNPKFRDQKKHVEWAQKAADLGLPEAQLNLGVAYSYGIGVPKDNKKALEWFHKAASQGSEEAMVNIALTLAMDRKSVKEALELLNRPILSSNARAFDAKESICNRYPDACPTKLKI
jgi:hypothetical protein